MGFYVHLSILWHIGTILKAAELFINSLCLYRQLSHCCETEENYRIFSDKFLSYSYLLLLMFSNIYGYILVMKMEIKLSTEIVSHTKVAVQTN